MDVCDRCERPAAQVAGRWVHAEYADAVFCSMVMAPAGTAPAPAPAGREPRRLACDDCGSMEFALYYDPVSQGRHAECAHCGTVAGGLR